MPGTRRTARTWVVTGIAVLGVAALPSAAAATTATVDGEVIRIVDEEGIDDEIVISAGGVDTDGVAWEIDGVDGVGELCQGTGRAFCTDGRFRDGGAPTRRFEIDLGGGDDELRYLVSSGHSGDEPEGEIRLGAGRDEVESRGLEAHTIDAGTDDDVIELAGFAPGNGGGVGAGSAPAGLVLDGGAGADTFLLAARRSGDTVLGGPGLDVASYAGRGPAVQVTLDGSADDGTGEEGDDVEPDVEALIGTAAADALTGSGGDELLDGGAGPDTLDGRGGDDMLSFASRSTDVTADLAAGTTSDGDGLTAFEHLRGGDGDDDLRGNAAANRVEGGDGADDLDGRAGEDTLVGGGDDDVLDGGPGAVADLLQGDAASRDTADYGARAQRVAVTLADGDAEAVTLDGDRLVRIANVIGGSANDRLIGNALGNRMHGGRGDDRIDGRGGDDRLSGDRGRDVIGALRAVPFGVCTFELGEGRVCTLDFFVASPTPDGRDTVRGGADDDLVSVRDGALDGTVHCGGGTDALRRDPLDPAPLACESVQTG